MDAFPAPESPHRAWKRKTRGPTRRVFTRDCRKTTGTRAPCIQAARGPIQHPPTRLSSSSPLHRPCSLDKYQALDDKPACLSAQGYLHPVPRRRLKFRQSKSIPELDPCPLQVATGGKSSPGQHVETGTEHWDHQRIPSTPHPLEARWLIPFDPLFVPSLLPTRAGECTCPFGVWSGTKRTTRFSVPFWTLQFELHNPCAKHLDTAQVFQPSQPTRGAQAAK